MDHVYNLSIFEAVELLRGGYTLAQYDPSMQCEVWMRRDGNRFEVSYGEGCRWTPGVCLFVHSRFRVVDPRYMDLQEFGGGKPLTIFPTTHQPQKNKPE